MYVDSDNLFSSNKCINASSNQNAISNIKHNKSNNRYYHADAIRNPDNRSNSMTLLATVNKNWSKRPRSSYSDSYFDPD